MKAVYALYADGGAGTDKVTFFGSNGGVADTILVMFHGRIVARLDPSEVTPRDLGSYMTGASVKEGVA